MKKVFKRLTSTVVEKLWIDDKAEIPKGYFADQKATLAGDIVAVIGPDYSIGNPEDALIVVEPEKPRRGRPRKQ